MRVRLLRFSAAAFWLAVLRALVGVPQAPAQAPADPWIGQRVITWRAPLLRTDDGFVEIQTGFRIYKVERANGPWLWIASEDSSVRGWALAESLVRFDQAVDHYTEAIRANPTDSSMYIWRAIIRNARNEFDLAIADYGEAIRLDPGSVLARLNRGSARLAKGDYDQAIADYTEVIRLDPGSTTAHANRGTAWLAKEDYDQAIADYTEVIRLDPSAAFAHRGRAGVWLAKRDYDLALADYTAAIRLDPDQPGSYRGRALARLSAGREGVDDDARAWIARSNWSEDSPIHASILGRMGARRAKKDDAAKAFLDDADAKANKALWPYPIVRFLRGEIDEKALLDQATDADKLTEARCYLAFDQLLNGRTAEARENFQWVKDHGTRSFVEVGLAVAELDRLEKEAPAEK